MHKHFRCISSDVFKSERGNQTVQSTSDSPIALIRRTGGARSDRAANVSVAIVARARELSAAKLRGRRLKLLHSMAQEGGMLQSPPRAEGASLSFPSQPTDRARDGPTPILSTDDVKSADGSAHAAATSNGDSFSEICLKI